MATKPKHYEHAVLILSDTPKLVEDQLNLLSSEGWETGGLTLTINAGKSVTVTGVIRREVK